MNNKQLKDIPDTLLHYHICKIASTMFPYIPNDHELFEIAKPKVDDLIKYKEANIKYIVEFDRRETERAIRQCAQEVKWKGVFNIWDNKDE